MGLSVRNLALFLSTWLVTCWSWSIPFCFTSRHLQSSYYGLDGLDNYGNGILEIFSIPKLQFIPRKEHLLITRRSGRLSHTSPFGIGD